MFFSVRLLEDEKEIANNATVLKLLLTKTSLAVPSLPPGLTCNKAVIVDLETAPNDWQDDHTWQKTRAPMKKSYEVKRNANGEIIDISRSSHGASGTYTMERHRYTHANSPDFHRLVVTVQESDGNYIPFAFVQYRFDGNEHFVRNKPHGNAKSKDPFIPTKKSTLEKLTAAVKSQGVKRAVHEVEVAVGGMYADSASSLPRNERQARCLKSKDKETSKSDPVSALLDMQLEEEKPFIRSVTVDRNSPIIVLFSDEQIKDLKKFCCNEDGPNSPLCIDMTFNLGNFYVVVTTYKHLQLLTKRSNNEPVILGPVMMCMKKDRPTYQFLFQQINSHCPEIKDQLKAYGTDVELPLRKALELEFPFALGFVCRKHIVRNLEHKLKTELNLSDKFFRKVVADVFGDKTQEGLVQCTTRAEYDFLLSKLCVKWDRDESEERAKKGDTQEPKAAKYFMKNKADIVYHHSRSAALREVGIDVELFDNNDPESINALIKKWENEEKSDIPKFVRDIKELHDKQRHDISRAFCGTPGLYAVKEDYAEFAVGAEFWKLGQCEKVKFLNKVSDLPLHPNQRKQDPLEPIGHLPFLPSEVSALKAKVARILDGNIRVGFSGPKSRIVCSDSGEQPHLVSAVSNHKYKCDASCLQFRARKVCSHTLAAASDNKDLQEFVNVYRSEDITPNITPVATAGGNKFAGRKPGDVPRVRRRSSEPLSAVAGRSTLGEVLSDIPPDFSQLHYQSKHQGGLKMVFTRVSAQRPPKPVSTSRSDEPFQLIDIQGNIRECFGCGLPLRDGPPKYGADYLDSQYCLRHKEEDHFYCEKYSKWIPKIENKHFHISKECVLRKHQQFNSSTVEVALKHTLTVRDKAFLTARL